MTDSSLSSASRIPEPTSLLLQPKYPLPRRSAHRRSTQVLAELRASIAVGGVDLDTMLQRIVDAALTFTDANGAAIALQHDNGVFCRARAGEMAPDLNSTIASGSGISGECLQSGKALCCHDTSADSRVDAAACRRLGLRSLVAAPIGERPVQGILEAFSARPYAFGDTELGLLKQLAELVSAAQQGSTQPVALVTGMPEKLASKVLSFSNRKLITVTLVVLVTFAFVVWLGLRKTPEHSSLAAAAEANSLRSESSSATVDFSRLELKPSPVTHGKIRNNSSAGVVLASRISKFGSGEGVMGGRPPEAASNADSPQSNVPALRPQPPQPPDNRALAPPPVADVSVNSEKAIAGLLSNSAAYPQPVMLSQGLSGGSLEYMVNPIYPSEARMLRRQGRVTLDGVIAEDGRLRQLKVVDGDPLLAGAAIEAVAKWRYHPYKLNGELIRMRTTITLIFKLP